MPLSLALGVRGTVAGQRLGALQGGASNGQVALSALGSGRACPAAVIAFCPSADARRFHSASCVQRSALAPAPAIRADCWPLPGYAYILVSGHSLPVLHGLLAPFGHTWLGFIGTVG